jgi:glutamyl-tRNA synthetase
MGYLPEALRNYLLRLGWSHGDAEIISDAQAIEWFTLDKVGKSPARFDFAKLKSVNHHYICRGKSDEELLDLAAQLFKKKISAEEKNKLLRAIKFVKERSELITELATNLEIYFDDFRVDFAEAGKDKKINYLEILIEKKSLIADLSTVLADLQDWTHDGIKNALNEFAAAKNLKIKDFGPALRIILTFSAASPGGIFDVIEILGKAEVLARIANCFSLSAS